MWEPTISIRAEIPINPIENSFLLEALTLTYKILTTTMVVMVFHSSLELNKVRPSLGIVFNRFANSFQFSAEWYLKQFCKDFKTVFSSWCFGLTCKRHNNKLSKYYTPWPKVQNSKFKRLNLDPNKVERLREKLFISLVEIETGAIPRTSNLDDGEDSDDSGFGARQVCPL